VCGGPSQALNGRRAGGDESLTLDSLFLVIVFNLQRFRGRGNSLEERRNMNWVFVCD
jgi:hypothetical protein